MARMIPARRRSEFTSPAEWHFYEACREQLPDHIVVLHGGRYLLRDPERWDDDGEIDFLVIDPNRGYLVVEVKGGRIVIEGEDWISIDRHGRRHRLKESPFEQAMKRKHGLIAKLQKAGVNTRRARFCHAVCFPDCRVDGDLSFEAPRAAIIDSDDLEKLPAAVERCFGGPRARGYVKPEEIDRVIELFGYPEEVPRARLGVLIRRGEREMARLTEEQARVLDYFSRNHRVLVTGCAGSGKTFLALAQARRLARAGYTVLVTCYNRSLATWMRRYLRDNAGLTRAEYKRIMVKNYHELARWYAQEARIPMFEPRSARYYFGRLPPLEGPSYWERYYEEYFPRLLERALELTDIRYDALIVDEGQDIPLHWWRLLAGTLKDRQRGSLFVFADDNEFVWRTAQGKRGQPADFFDLNTGRTVVRYEQEPLVRGIVPSSLGPFTVLSLRANLRNARPIAALAARYYFGPWPIRACGPDGPSPEFVPRDGDSSSDDAVDRVVARLVHEEGVPPEAITVLVPRFSAKPGLLPRDFFGELSGIPYRRVTPDRPAAPGCVRMSTIPGFRGLESPVVILAATERMEEFISWTSFELTYLALTRAAQHLIVIGELPDPESPDISTLLEALRYRLEEPLGFPADVRRRAEALEREAQSLLDRRRDLNDPWEQLLKRRRAIQRGERLSEPGDEELDARLDAFRAEWMELTCRLDQIGEEIQKLLQVDPSELEANGTV